MDPTALPTFQNLPTHLFDPFLGAVRTNQTNDEFESSGQYFTRLQSFALGPRCCHKQGLVL